MANLQTHNILGVHDKRTGAGSGTTPLNAAMLGNLKDVNSMRTRLTAISSTTYTPARLDAMTVNDMIYAIRLNDDPAGL